MKKLLLAAFMITTFALYSWHQRSDGSAPVIPPVSASQKSAATATSTSPAPMMSRPMMAGFKDGQYTGSAADALYGNIQVKAIIQGGSIVDVQFLQYPNEQPNSIRINSQAMPYLKQEAISAQSSQVDVISGATDTSNAFIQSLASALAQAKV